MKAGVYKLRDKELLVNHQKLGENGTDLLP